MLVLIAIVPYITSIGKIVDPDIEFTAEGHDIDGPDIAVLSGHHLESIYLNATLDEKGHGFPLSIYHFHARTEGGRQIWSMGWIDDGGIDMIPGESVHFGIYFEVPDGDTITAVFYVKPSGRILAVELSVK